tara:strand:- start:579 stop:1298 length:720 start_codon:yes stop_codon:yes gene_type:complete
LHEAVGARPARSWREEWLSVQAENLRLEGSAVQQTTPRTVDRLLQKFAWVTELRLGLLWPREQAEAFALLSTWGAAALAHALEMRDGRFAASSHMVHDALVRAARSQLLSAPPTYAWLTGRGGLLTNDAAWRFAVGAAVAAPQLRCFETRAVALSSYSAEQMLRSRCAASEDANLGLVRFSSAPPCGAGLRSLVDVGSGRYAVPPLATVIVEKVEEPWQWELAGRRFGFPLTTVSVVYA